MTDALDRGARIFKLHLQVGGFDPRTAELDAVWGLLAETGTPIVVHAGSGPVAGGFTGPGPIGDVLARHPRLAILVAHLGAPEYEGFLGLTGKILLGSDFPNIPYPYAHQIEALERLDLGDDWLRAVCWQNAATRFGWKG